ncbi:MAG: phosphotransferase [bacterium]|nr:phosphotransferase [bacterium]
MKKFSSEEIKKYFSRILPLGSKTKLLVVSYLCGGNHFNYLLKTNHGKFVMRVSNPLGLGAGALFDIPDEFTLLKLIEKYKVAPRAEFIDLEGFFAPLLIEEYIDGIPYNQLRQISEGHLKGAIELMQKVSRISLDKDVFPFRFSYHTYGTNIRGWHLRMEEIVKLGRNNKTISTSLKLFNEVAGKAAKILDKNQRVLSAAKPVFIYNDVHGNNLFWVEKNKKPIFIDWQKVSRGDPAFMAAVFALAFENNNCFGGRGSFFKWVVESYGGSRNFERLFWLRILEREVANMIWVVWASLKQGRKLPFKNIGEYERFNSVKEALRDFPFA